MINNGAISNWALNNLVLHNYLNETKNGSLTLSNGYLQLNNGNFNLENSSGAIFKNKNGYQVAMSMQSDDNFVCYQNNDVMFMTLGNVLIAPNNTNTSDFNSVVVTRNIYAGDSGYIVFGNNVRLEWGVCSSGTITSYHLPFINNPYVGLTPNNVNVNSTTMISVTNVSNTSFIPYSSLGWDMRWVAIGI